MLAPKPCHRGLQAKSRLFGLEPLDALLLFPGLYVCIVVLHRPLVGVAVALATGVALRIIKWGRLPGYTLALAMFILVASHHPCLGHDRAPVYPRS